MKSLCIFIMICLASFAYGAESCIETKFDVCYIPLEVHFYVPPTESDVCYHRSSFQSKEICALYLALLRSEKNPAGHDSLALMRIIVTNTDTADKFYITQEKQVIFKDMECRVDLKLVDTAVMDIAKNFPSLK